VLSLAGSLRHVSTGDIFRGLAPDSPAGKVASQYASQGLLVPDDVTIEIFLYYLNGLIATNRYRHEEQFLLLDGIPRTLNQATLLDAHIDVQQIIVLETDNSEELIQRLQRRAKLEGRQDDADPEVLRRRQEVYATQTQELLGHYPDAMIARFNADQKPLEVLRDVLATLASNLTCVDRPLPNAG
jgi:adenylate kinase